MATQFDPFMRGVRSNCLRFADNLRACGFVFDEPPVAAPRANNATTFAMIEEAGASIPTALRSFYEIVGSIEFLGRAPSTWRGCKYPDPISIAPLDHQFWQGEIEAWKDDPLEAFGERFAPQASGDHIHKAGYSGGAYYIIFDDADDPSWWAPGATMSFTQYLRLSIEWGGFPGLLSCPDHTWPLDRITQGAISLS